LWIVQEIVLAKPVLVLCGSKTFRFAELSRLFSELSQAVYKTDRSDKNQVWDFSGSISISKAATLIETKRRIEKHTSSKETVTLNEVMELTVRLVGSDLRDKIFAVISLVPNSQISVDYSKSTRQLHRECVKACSRRSLIVDCYSFSRLLSSALGLDKDETIIFSLNERFIAKTICTAIKDRLLDPAWRASGEGGDLDLTILPKLKTHAHDVALAVLQPFMPPTKDSTQRFWMYVSTGYRPGDPGLQLRYLDHWREILGRSQGYKALSNFVCMMFRAILFFTTGDESLMGRLEPRIPAWSVPNVLWDKLYEVGKPFILLREVGDGPDDQEAYVDPAEILRIAGEMLGHRQQLWDEKFKASIKACRLSYARRTARRVPLPIRFRDRSSLAYINSRFLKSD
jgi:hypothetical protein